VNTAAPTQHDAAPATTPTSFDAFSLSDSMRIALREAGYHTPTPIQAATIAPALEGRDVIGAAQTGTGKTAAFLVPIVERLRRGQDGRNAMAVILGPTRELAEQIHGWAQRLGAGMRSALIVGGVPFGPQVQALHRRPALIVATPGRLVDHLDRRTADLGSVAVFVLDEADRMLDMGFKPQLDRVMRALPPRRQTLLFSATMPPDLGALARMHLRDAVRVSVGPQALPPVRATQDVYLVEAGSKTPLLLSLAVSNPGNMLVFARTKHRTDRITRALCAAGHRAQRLHSNRSQAQRREALDGFRRGRYRILVATDIAARGIDVAGIARVINYDLPQTVEDYVHRVGRTARADAAGHASSFAAPEEHGQLRAIERHIGTALLRHGHASEGAARTPRPHVADARKRREGRAFDGTRLDEAALARSRRARTARTRGRHRG
jgi:ATP-dependent RNA helicase RhlE